MSGGSKTSQSMPTPRVIRLPLSPQDLSPVRPKKGTYSNLAAETGGRESTILSEILNGSRGFLGA